MGTLREWIATSRSLCWCDWIYVEPGPLRLDTAFALQTSDGQDMKPLRELLQVADFWSVLDAWANYRDGRLPNEEQALRAIQYYDTHDAFIGPELDP